ncbi:hypothetical protein ACHAXN_012584 [Cyclotella atomus]
MTEFKSISIVPTAGQRFLDSCPDDEDTFAAGSFKRSFSSTSVGAAARLSAPRKSQVAAATSKYSSVSISEAPEQPIYQVPSLADFIDNSKRIYTPHKLRCGVTVQVGEGVLEECPTVLRDLNHDLIGCLSVLPPSVRSLVRRTKIWLNRTYSFGPKSDPKNVKHTTAHHFAGWLYCVRDNPEKEESIEIYNASEYLKTRAHYNGGGLMLHELCHIIHQKVLPGGLENTMVSEIYKVAKESNKYNTVLRRDWAMKETETDMAYCIVNHKEFFAEISTTFLADFYHEVDGAGGHDMERSSPPIVSAAVIERIAESFGDGSFGKYQIIEDANRVIPHCNKFFPFTKGQLRLYDPRVYKCFEKLWKQIECWEDKDKRRCESCVWF